MTIPQTSSNHTCVVGLRAYSDPCVVQSNVIALEQALMRFRFTLPLLALCSKRLFAVRDAWDGHR